MSIPKFGILVETLCGGNIVKIKIDGFIEVSEEIRR
jgi:hypothetical protein